MLYLWEHRCEASQRIPDAYAGVDADAPAGRCGASQGIGYDGHDGYRANGNPQVGLTGAGVVLWEKKVQTYLHLL